jgi:hypothetical protein
MKINELSNDKLADYKKKASDVASEADKKRLEILSAEEVSADDKRRAEDYRKRADKRFRGTVKATIKQFDNDLKKHKKVDESQEIDINAVVGKLYDIIDNQDQAIKTADYDKQVRYATTVRDRAQQALEMIQADPKSVNAAWKYFQTGERLEEGEITEEMIAARLMDEWIKASGTKPKDNSILQKKSIDNTIQNRATQNTQDKNKPSRELQMWSNKTKQPKGWRE